MTELTTSQKRLLRRHKMLVNCWHCDEEVMCAYPVDKALCEKCAKNGEQIDGRRNANL